MPSPPAESQTLLEGHSYGSLDGREVAVVPKGVEESCLQGGASLGTCKGGVTRGAVGCWLLLAAGHCRSCNCYRSTCWGKLCPLGAHQNEQATLSLLWPLLTKLNIVPPGKERIFKGPRSTSRTGSGWIWSCGYKVITSTETNSLLILLYSSKLHLPFIMKFVIPSSSLFVCFSS